MLTRHLFFVTDLECLFWIIAAVSFVDAFLVSDSPIVKTKYGKIRGIEVTKNGEPLYKFLQIPYAEPPVANLRFNKPTAKMPWTGILNASVYGPACPQYSQFISKMSEDCLFLNIYVPRGIDPVNKKAVMVWIHGGGYVVGTGSNSDGSTLALHGDVIVVTINYRLGLLGFLSTENDIAPGNYGLWDQIWAIKWVKENINAFGGNPDMITIFGESAGGYSVGLLSMLPQTKGLFHRVIAESGVGLSPRAISHNAKKTLVTIAKLLNCTGATDPRNYSEIISCLRKERADDIISIVSNLLKEDDLKPTFIIRFGPVVDGDLIPDTPLNMLSNVTSESHSIFMSRDFMTGSNDGDGALIVYYYPPPPNFNISGGVSTKLFCNRIVSSVADDYFNSNSNISEAICSEYTATNFTLQAQALKSVDFYGDFCFAAPTIHSLNIHMTSQRQTFQYLFSHMPDHSYVKLPSWFQRANHAVEVPFVFGIQQRYPNASSVEVTLSNLMMTYWTNFAKYGDPNGLNPSPQWDWPSYKTNSSYLNIDISVTNGTNLYKDRMDFWLKRIPNYGMA